jgi:Domain of unknown function (DUF1735)
MKNNKLLIFGFFVLTAFFSSCLKDKGYDDSTYGTKISGKSVVFSQSEQNLGVTANTTPVAYKVVMLQASAEVAASADLNVVVKENPALLSTYSGGATALTALPAGAVTFPSTTTIKAGSYFDTLAITVVKGSLLDLSKTYGIGLSITSADGGYSVSHNKKDILLVINVNSEYAGSYKSTGIRTRYNGPTLASGILDNFPFTDLVKPFSTVGANVIKGGIADASGSGVVATLTVNANNTVTITSTAGTNPLGVINDPAFTSTYTPGTKTFKLYVAYLNTAGNLRVASETMVKQ